MAPVRAQSIYHGPICLPAFQASDSNESFRLEKPASGFGNSAHGKVNCVVSYGLVTFLWFFKKMEGVDNNNNNIFGQLYAC